MEQELTPVQQRLFDFLPDKPRWGFEKQARYISKKEDILFKANYIQLPTQKRKYIALDLDYEFAGEAWSNDILPEPTVVIINRENSHAHYLYEIENPVVLPLINSTIKISWKAINYFKAVQAGYQNKLEADKGYVGYLIKNPFSPKWKTRWADRTYDLDYLADFVDLPNIYQVIQDDDSIEGRHMRMFHICRKEAYKEVKKYNEYEGFVLFVKKICLDYYRDFLVAAKNNLDFPVSEAESIANSIAKWVWLHKDDKNFRNYTKNKGAMKLVRPIGAEKITGQELKLRESQGAYYTHEQRRNRTADKILDAKKRLEESGEEVTIKRLTEVSGVSKPTICRYKHMI
jgi:hypothetical protein